MKSSPESTSQTAMNAMTDGSVYSKQSRLTFRSIGSDGRNRPLRYRKRRSIRSWLTSRNMYAMSADWEDGWAKIAHSFQSLYGRKRWWW
jgi:hypothetical protein